VAVTPAPPAVAAVHLRNNALTAASWDAYAEHRRQLTALLRRVGRGRVAVLGAGNANDLAFDQLGPRLSELHLVDLDGQALDRAATRAVPQLPLVLHAGVDVTCALPWLAEASADGPAVRPVPAARLEALATAPGAALPARLPGPFDTVLSACLLTQLLHSARLALGAAHPDLPAVAGALVTGHLRGLAALLAPGGIGLLVTDVVSSVTYPLEARLAAGPALAVLEDLLESGGLFTGTNPEELLTRFDQDPTLATAVEAPGLHEPWAWRPSAELTLLVCALSFRRRA
jgi:hypothetical protein